jgi:tRNA dimethylallyltransferase
MLQTRINKPASDANDRGGALDEVRELLSLEVPPLHPVMKAIGVRQLADPCRGTSLEHAIELVKRRHPSIRKASDDLVPKSDR